MAISTSTRLTYEDYASFPEDGRRHEIIGGEHYVVPSPFIRHQAISHRLEYVLLKYLEQNPVGTLFDAPCDVVLSDLDVVQPDLIYISKDHESIITEKNIRGVPDLLVEIISESTRRTDEITKRKLYEHAGVREYWVIDPVVDTVKIYRLEDGRYQREAEISGETGGMIESPLMPGLRIDVGEVFRD